jgi:hypothetical protein
MPREIMLLMEMFTEVDSGSETVVQVKKRNLKKIKFINKTKQNKTKQNKTKQNKTKQNKTKQNKTKQTKSGYSTEG